MLVVASVDGNPGSTDRVVRMSRLAAEPTTSPDDPVVMVTPAVEQA